MKKHKDAKPTKQFETSVIAPTFIHKVLRLPIARPEFNLIELG